MALLTVERSLPGTFVFTNTSQVARPAQRQPTSTFFLVLYSTWGPPNKPESVTSWLEYLRKFGPMEENSHGDDALYTFFNRFPGTQSWVVRVVGSAAVKGFVNLMDRAVVPLATLKLAQKHPSSKADIRWKIEAGTLAATFKLTVRSIHLSAVGFETETFDNLTLSADSISFVNRTSKLIDQTNLFSATAAPNNLPALSAVVGGVVQETVLPAGDDDFAGLTAADYIGSEATNVRTGLQAFNDRTLGTGQVAIPGITTAATHAALAAHADRFKRLACLDPAYGSDADSVVAQAGLVSSYRTAMSWPWVKVLSYDGSGVEKFIAPSGWLAGICALNDRTIGTHKSPGNTVLPTALDVERLSSGASQVDDGVHERLNRLNINVIRSYPPGNIKYYGGRVLTNDPRVKMIHEARVLNLIEFSIEEANAFAPFSVVGEKLFRDLRTTATDFLRLLYQDGALYGETEKDAFLVTCDPSNNPKSELDNGRVHELIGVALSPTAEQILINLENVRLFQSLSVLQ